MSVESYRGSPGKFASRTLNRKTLDRWTGRTPQQLTTMSVYFTGRLHSPCACPWTLTLRGTGKSDNDHMSDEFWFHRHRYDTPVWARNKQERPVTEKRTVNATREKRVLAMQRMKIVYFCDRIALRRFGFLRGDTTCYLWLLLVLSSDCVIWYKTVEHTTLRSGNHEHDR